MGDNISLTAFPQSIRPPAVATSTVTTSAVDVSGYRGSAFVVHCGASADTLSGSVYWTAKLQSSATELGTYADVADADVQIASTNAFGLVNDPAEDDELYWIGYNGTDAWVKVVITATGTHTNGTPISVFVLFGLPDLGGSTAKVNP